MCCGGSQSSQSQNIPRELKPLFSQTGQTIQGLQPQIAGQFDQFFGSNPQQIPGLTDEQQQLQQAMLARATGQERTPEEQYAFDQIQQLTGGPLGQSPATLAAMQAVRTPALNDLALAGLGNSDAVATNLAAAYSPILAQEMAQRAGLAPMTATIGNTAANRQTEIINQAFAGQEAGRQVSEAQAKADYNDFLRRMGLGEEFTTGLLGSFPVLGKGSSSTTGQFGTLICTELHRAGLMDDETYDADQKYGALLSHCEYLGYLTMAMPIVMFMRRSKIAKKFIAVFGLAIGKEMKRVIRGGEGSRLGAFILRFGLPLCRFVGERKMKLASWRENAVSR